jgi:LPS sulfotransferase NodH
MRIASHQELIAGLGAGRDYPPPERRVLLVLFTPCAGNFYLADILTREQRFGEPAEYFNHDTIRALMPAVGAASEADYLSAIETTRASPDGVFSMLITMGDIERFERLDIFARYHAAGMVYLRRRNLLEQAVDLYLALRPEACAEALADDAAAERLVAEPAAPAEIRDWCAHILRYELSAEVEIARRGLAPVRILHEDLAADPAAVLDRFYALIGAARGAGGPPPMGSGGLALAYLSAALQQCVLTEQADFLTRVYALRPPFEME